VAGEGGSSRGRGSVACGCAFASNARRCFNTEGREGTEQM
jgi:hypothetical protein